MTNADKFKNIFGLYATELWSMPEKDFLKWLNSEAMNCSEFPNNSDTISRQAAIAHAVPLNLFGREVMMVSVSELENLPSAQPEQRWIPCSETVDIPEHEVLCCDKYGEELIGWLSCKDDQWVCESEVEIMYDTVAWMEKPEPWKGEQHE